MLLFFKDKTYIRVMLMNLILIIICSIFATKLVEYKMEADVENLEKNIYRQIYDYDIYENRNIPRELNQTGDREQLDNILSELSLDKYNSRIYRSSYSTIHFLILLISIMGIFFIIYLINYIYFSSQQKKYIRDIDRFINSVTNKSFDTKLQENDESIISNFNNKFNKLGLAIEHNYHTMENEYIKLKDSLADISHQVKTPLTALKMYNELLLDSTNLDEAQIEFLNLSEKQIDRLKWLISSLLKISRFEANAIVFKKERFEVSKLSAHFNDLLINELKEKNLKIRETGDTYEEVFLDYNWTSEALLNIVKNATEHAEENSTIIIDYAVNVAFVSISVSNKGKNIPDDELTKLFKRFYKSKDSVNSESIGIGLNLSKHIIKSQLGTISVENTEDGVLFNIVFLR